MEREKIDIRYTISLGPTVKGANVVIDDVVVVVKGADVVVVSGL